MATRLCAASVLLLVAASTTAMAARGTHEAGAFFGLDAPLPVTLIPDGEPLSGTPLDRARGVAPAYGILGYHWRWNGFWKPNVAMGLSLNTETLQADLWAWNVFIPGSSFNAWARGELALAGVNTQWIQDGVNHLERGFTASYAQVGARAAHTAGRVFTVEAELGFRAWLFTPIPLITQQPGLATPTPLLVAEPRVRIKYDDRRRDEGNLGLYKGIACVIESAMDLRAVARPFGTDSRNTLRFNSVPRRISVRGFMGANAFKALWLQASTEAGYGVNEDDISRARIGGLNPYTVNMPGTAWGEFVSERYAAAHLELGLTTMKWLYTGISAHAVVLNDPHRLGYLNDYGLVRGLAAEVRVGLWGFGVFHFRGGGNSDVLRPGGHGALSAFGWLEVWWPR